MINGIPYLLFCFKVINVIEENFPHERVLITESNFTRSINSGFNI